MRAAVCLMPSNQPPGRGIPEKSAKAKNGERQPPTILVVEDEVLIRMAVGMYLRECGYRVLEAASAAEAQVILKAGEPIEIVFSDINMPGTMDGADLAEWVRRNFPDVKVILTSGVTNLAKNAAELCSSGKVLDKPYDHESLAQHIKKLLGEL
jgi:CheY-like chemotaxis protein